MSQSPPNTVETTSEAGLVMGYKVFYYWPHAGELHSSDRSSFQWWPERTSEEALCDDTERNVWAPHEVASEIHTCGFHMYYSFWRAVGRRHACGPPSHPESRPLVCLVAAWGRVARYYSGTRSSHMEVVAVHDPGHERFRSGELASLAGLPYLGNEEIRDYADLYETKLIMEELSWPR